MELRLLEPRRRGVAANSGAIAAAFQWTREAIDGGERWSPSPALPAHALGALRLELAAGPALSGLLSLERDAAEPIVQAVELAASDAPRVLVLDALHASADARPGPDIVALRWLAALPLASPPEPRARLPRVQFQSLLEGPLVLQPEAAPPRLRIEPALEGPAPRYARVRFEIAMPLDSANFYADVPLGGPGPWEIAIEHLHLGVEEVPAQTTWPWAEFFEIARSMGLLELDPSSAEVALWVELTSASGLPLAQCTSLRLPWSRGPD